MSDEPATVTDTGTHARLSPGEWIPCQQRAGIFTSFRRTQAETRRRNSRKSLAPKERKGGNGGNRGKRGNTRHDPKIPDQKRQMKRKGKEGREEARIPTPEIPDRKRQRKPTSRAVLLAVPHLRAPRAEESRSASFERRGSLSVGALPRRYQVVGLRASAAKQRQRVRGAAPHPTHAENGRRRDKRTYLVLSTPRPKHCPYSTASRTPKKLAPSRLREEGIALCGEASRRGLGVGARKRTTRAIRTEWYSIQEDDHMPNGVVNRTSIHAADDSRTDPQHHWCIVAASSSSESPTPPALFVRAGMIFVFVVVVVTNQLEATEEWGALPPGLIGIGWRPKKPRLDLHAHLCAHLSSRDRTCPITEPTPHRLSLG
ncbi:hypothetical protein B0H13DRAFT_1921157 [Mycena leptocephala]|nr:hypothetical protein B0H13DRAFT_1921157 [Mycena leptocephala]